jgi:hypothetical protein
MHCIDIHSDLYIQVLNIYMEVDMRFSIYKRLFFVYLFHMRVDILNNVSYLYSNCCLMNLL